MIGLTLAVVLIALCGAAAYVLRIGSSSVGALPGEDLRDRLQVSRQYDGTRFVNAEPTTVIHDGGYWTIIKNHLKRDKNRRLTSPLPSVAPNLARFAGAPAPAAIWLGHATVLLKIDGTTLLTDPVFEDEVDVFIGSTKRFAPSPLKREDLPPIDAVLISHDHYDHLELPTVRYLAERGTRFLVPLGVGAHLKAWGVPDSQIVQLDWWERTKVGETELVCTPARHYSGRSPSRVNCTLWSSWAILGTEHRVFYGGDTGYSNCFAEVGKRCGPFDLAMLPIGAYGDAWPDIHMTPEQAVQAQMDLDAGLMLPVHWGTFDLAFHPWDEPIARLDSTVQRNGTTCTMPRPGAVVVLGDSLLTDPWWQREQ